MRDGVWAVLKPKALAERNVSARKKKGSAIEQRAAAEHGHALESNATASMVTKFIRKAASIRAGWKKRQDRGPQAGSFEEDAHDWLRRETYKFLKRQVEENASIFDDVIKQNGRGRCGPDLKRQVFKKGLKALFPNDDIIPRQRRQAWGDQFEYAHRHAVPSKFLAGFIAQAGSRSTIQAKLRERFVEPGFGSVQPKAPVGRVAGDKSARTKVTATASPHAKSVRTKKNGGERRKQVITIIG